MGEEIKIVCFGSGDFPIEAFETLVKNYKVVGFVTSKDKAVFGNKRVYDIAKENNIPVYIPDNLESKEFLDWLDEIDGNVYCVISYKFLPECVVNKARKFAFNIHASLLPLLRGAAPINWAIRYGFERTGITSIKLSNKIDTGGIIYSWGVDIKPEDNYETLYKRLSSYSTLMVDTIILDIESYHIQCAAEQPIVPKSLDSKIFHAPKLNKENTTFSYYDNVGASATDIHNMVRSLSPNIGATFKMSIRKWVCGDGTEDEGEFDDVKDIVFKVYETEIVDKGHEWIDKNYDGSDIITDWKNYFYILPPSCGDNVVSVKQIQLPGKKILDVKEFLKGFQNFNKPNYNFFLN